MVNGDGGGDELRAGGGGDELRAGGGGGGSRAGGGGELRSDSASDPRNDSASELRNDSASEPRAGGCGGGGGKSRNDNVGELRSDSVGGSRASCVYDLVSLGEILIDFTPAGSSPAGDALFQRNLGGGAVNLACAFANLGGRCAFIGKAGDDGFGHFCAGVLRARGVDVAGLLFDKSRGTTLAFVHLSEDGDRSFSFYRRGSADVSLDVCDIDERIIRSSRAFHFGGVSLTDEPARSATMHGARVAKGAGRLVSFDPNLRLNLWQSPQDAKDTLLAAFPLADVVKLSEEEAQFLFGLGYRDALREIARRYGTPLSIVTLAERGAVAVAVARASAGGAECSSPAFDVDIVDTTGAGDCFLSGALRCILEFGKPPGDLSQDELADMLAFANAAGSLVCTKMGAIAAQPSLEEVERMLATRVKLKYGSGVKTASDEPRGIFSSGKDSILW